MTFVVEFSLMEDLLPSTLKKLEVVSFIRIERRRIFFTDELRQLFGTYEPRTRVAQDCLHVIGDISSTFLRIAPVNTKLSSS